jgi:ubiquinone/menaquinone biosynthesis C-methylase UbiE
MSDRTSIAPPGNEGWDPIAEQWDAWSRVTEALFAPATQMLLEQLGVRPGERVLELAAGSGGLTLPLARAVGPRGSVVATDLGPKLIALTARHARDAGLSNVTARVMDGQRPDLPDGSVGVVACRQGLMLFPDPTGTLERVVRVLRPAGRIGLTVFSTPDRNEFVAVPAGAVARWSPEGSPAKTPGPGPFSLGAPGQLESLLRRVGFRDVRTRLASSWFRPSGSAEMLRFYREVLGGLVADVPDAEKESAWKAIGAAIAPFSEPDSPGASCEILVATGRRD